MTDQKLNEVNELVKLVSHLTGLNFSGGNLLYWNGKSTTSLTIWDIIICN